MEIAISAIERQEKYKLLIGCIVPRPIAWVTSLGHEGVLNAAPFSYFNVASIEPMMVSIAVMRKPGSVMKDTARNILESGEFVVNMVDAYNVDAVNETSADYPPEISEVEALQLSTMPSASIRTPRLAASRIHFECRLHQIVTLGDPVTSDLVIGEVVHVHVDDSLYQDGRIDIAAFAPVSRLAGHSYARVAEPFDRPRPVYSPDRKDRP
ncbi:flavin reductase family protein [Brevibacillus composti]|uniref:Flavin reductase family protein n=1 Tax=Brevibacillus composti TaxID=2796470 RepID=A0A7T5JPN1_9BACL|nr:flavin reductase family protein [Brevibacillus composti]QQE75628.1 flavin reductase family protein [Brevibacillus composti]QUO42654.1 flavin reductase family protein [Brevibacillus composti]